MPIWRAEVINEIWLILNYSKVIWDIKPKCLPHKVLIRCQLFTKFEVHSCTQNGFPAKTILNLKWAWEANFWATPTKLGKFVTFWEIYKSYYYHFWKFLTVEKMLEPSSPGFQSFLPKHICNSLLIFGWILDTSINLSGDIKYLER